MITALKKNHKKRLPFSIKREMGLKAIQDKKSITALSIEHECSRGTVYAQRNKAILAVNQAFEDNDDNDVLYCIPITKTFIRQVVLSLLLISQSSYRNILFFLQAIFDYPLSLGSVFNIIDEACQQAQSINTAYDLSLIKTSAADELFHRNKPTLATVDIDSRYCALLAGADNRDYETWGIHLLDLQKQGYSPDTTLMDSAKGWVKGHEEVLPQTVRRHDHFHFIKDLKDCSRYLKHREASTITSTLKLLKKAEKPGLEDLKKERQASFAHALKELEKLESVRQKFNLLSQWLQFDVLQLAGHPPEIRALLYDFILAEMTQLARQHPHRIEAIVTSLNTQRDALLAVANELNQQFEKLAEKYQQPTDVIWRVGYAMRYSMDNLKYHDYVRELEGLIGEKYDELEDEVLSILDNTHRCSSMVENFNSRLRPYLDEKKNITQKVLSLIQFYLNHKPFMRSHHERLKNKTPAQAMTGKAHPHWLEMLGFTPFKNKPA
jgi:hypothetical protein